MNNFPNGALVFRVFSTGDCEVFAKFAYFMHACEWAKSMAKDCKDDNIFFLSVCENECRAETFLPKGFKNA